MSKSSASTTPHPLATRLVAEAASREISVLEIGRGSGRNHKAITESGAALTSIATGQRPDPGEAFDAVLSTHALLHGTPASIAAILESIYTWLKPEGRLYATFGSKRDSRYGVGTQISEHVFAPTTGDETGVAHAYWDAVEIRALLKDFRITEIEETQVDEIAGAWAHKETPLVAAFHWFVVAGKR